MAESPTALRAKIIEALFLGEGVEDKADRIMAAFANEPLDRLAAFLRGVGYDVRATSVLNIGSPSAPEWREALVVPAKNPLGHLPPGHLVDVEPD
jgi:hypothetical protein